MAQGLFNLKQQLQGLIQKAWGGSQTTPYVEYLVVAGGGGGGVYGGGGGGAGGLVQGITPVTAGSSITVTIGSGGAGKSTSYSVGGSGTNSVLGNITAIGGGGGNSYSSSTATPSGGSGGGNATSNGTTVGQGLFGQGNLGGAGYSSGFGGGAGGGGAGTVGLNGTSTNAGNGGAGIASSINGTLTTYAGGGGAGFWTGTTAFGIGGVGGGGAGGSSGGSPSGNGTAGTANTGGGGGATGSQPEGAGTSSGSGGSGIVIISYPDTYNAPASTTGSPTVSTSGSGSLSFNGSSNYLSSSSTITLSGDFTIEGWMYVNATSGTYTVLTIGDTIAANNGIELTVYSSSTSFLVYSNSTNIITSTGNVFLNSWFHVAVTRSGTSLKLFLNGTQVGSTAISVTSFTGTIYVGNEYYNGALRSQWWSGYLSNIRIVNGTALYTSNFTVPSAPLTPVTNTKLLMNTVSGAYDADSSGTYTMSSSASPSWNQSSPFATGLGYKNRVYTWTGSGTVTF